MPYDSLIATQLDTEMANYTAPTFTLVLDACRGRKGLRTSKPKGCGYSAYVWRMARFHSGADVTMPVMCEFDLANYADHSYSKSSDEDRAAYAALRKQADADADRVCDALGISKYAGAGRWARAFGYV